jgi:hypothetical protein
VRENRWDIVGEDDRDVAVVEHRDRALHRFQLVVHDVDMIF